MTLVVKTPAATPLAHIEIFEDRKPVGSAKWSPELKLWLVYRGPNNELFDSVPDKSDIFKAFRTS